MQLTKNGLQRNVRFWWIVARPASVFLVLCSDWLSYICYNDDSLILLFDESLVESMTEYETNIRNSILLLAIKIK